MFLFQSISFILFSFFYKEKVRHKEKVFSVYSYFFIINFFIILFYEASHSLLNSFTIILGKALKRKSCDQRRNHLFIIIILLFTFLFNRKNSPEGYSRTFLNKHGCFLACLDGNGFYFFQIKTVIFFWLILFLFIINTFFSWRFISSCFFSFFLYNTRFKSFI